MCAWWEQRCDGRRSSFRFFEHPKNHNFFTWDSRRHNDLCTRIVCMEEPETYFAAAHSFGVEISRRICYLIWIEFQSNKWIRRQIRYQFAWQSMPNVVQQNNNSKQCNEWMISVIWFTKKTQRMNWLSLTCRRQLCTKCEAIQTWGQTIKMFICRLAKASLSQSSLHSTNT